jgi:YcaO cyclodehydratase, ATP-ad Mg2+-binding
MQLFSEPFQAHLNSKYFTPFLKGVEVKLPDGRYVTLKIEERRLLPEKQLFKFQRYTYVTTMSAGDAIEYGCGDADYEILALQKSVAEAVERCLFRKLKGTAYGTRTSNGWAAHVSRKLTAKSAIEELLERDAVLVHALREIPFVEVEADSFPVGLREWADRELSHTELSRLRLLVSTAGHVPSLSVMFANSEGYGVVAHAVGGSPLSALKRALTEACRLGRSALRGHWYESSASLFSERFPEANAGDHAVAFAYYKPFPVWMFGKKTRWTDLSAAWKGHMDHFKRDPIPFTFTEIIRGPISAGFCTSPDIQSLYFGTNKDAVGRGEINRDRLNLKTGEMLQNTPHFVA